MLAKKYKSKIISISNKIKGVYTLEFESLGRKFKYLPGQFLHIAIDMEYDGIGQWPDSRCFSMQSSPDQKTIKITYSLKGEFTKRMENSLKVGSDAWLKLPYGDLFQQNHSKENTVFIAGGTGITPFLSLFTDESFNKYINSKIYLGFRSKEYNIYNRELKYLSNSIKSLKCYYENEYGKLDIHKIFDKNSIDSCYFISGPPAMIEAFKNTLINKGVPAGNVLTDNWE